MKRGAFVAIAAAAVVAPPLPAPEIGVLEIWERIELEQTVNVVPYSWKYLCCTVDLAKMTLVEILETAP